MKDTMNNYVIEMDNGITFEVASPLEDDLLPSLIDNYYKGRIVRFWANGVEWKEPTE